MRKLCFWASALSACLLTGTTMAAPPYWAIPPGGLIPEENTVLSESDYRHHACCPEGEVRNATCRSCGARQKSCHCAAAQACFNCTCQGSYKFPVPPQSTYFWPGMYSQKTIVDYNMPYRYPMLELPRWDETASTERLPVAKPFLQQTSLQIPAGEQTESRPPSELTSRKIDWLHKLR